jgi:hypothetical protein
MLGRHAGSILPNALARSRNCRSRGLAPRRVASGIAFVGGLLVFATAWSQAPRSDPSHASIALAKPRPVLDAGPYAQAGSATDTISDTNHLVSLGNKTPSFLGYLEFDWDLDRTGGMPGFGEWMPSATSIEVAGTNPVRK